MYQSLQNFMNLFLNFWIIPPQKKILILLPLSYTFFLQLLTGFPKPNSLEEINANEIFIRFSEELFDYPYWLQDLSHLPLFFIFAWLWSWQIGPYTSLKKVFSNKAAIISFSYAVINEMGQAFIPDRFPSIGDLIMNLTGVAFGLSSHKILCQKNSNLYD